MNSVLSASGIISLASAMKNPAEIGLGSEATIFPANFDILNDLIVFIPAGPSAPGTRIVFAIFFKEYNRDLTFRQNYSL